MLIVIKGPKLKDIKSSDVIHWGLHRILQQVWEAKF